MADDISVMVNLINALTTNSQDDTDPSNVVLQKFLSPQDILTYIETNTTQKWVPPTPTDTAGHQEIVTTLHWGTSGFKWAGDGSAVTFQWNQGGIYS